MTSPEANRQLIEEHYAAVWSGDETAVRRQVAADFVDHAMPDGTPPGPEAVLELSRTLRSGFPDMQVTVLQAVAEGDRVAVHARWSGTHQGRFRGLDPTGRRVGMEGMVFWRVADGCIAERWAVLDTESLQRRLGGDRA
ncbi:MAG TPA: ester cyclase [Gammaproteobacteria bacterium]|nr:ester cyclase [Gammaproteobacteria bacterium]